MGFPIIGSAVVAHFSGCDWPTRMLVLIVETRLCPTGRIKLINFDILSKPRVAHPRTHRDYDTRSDVRLIYHSVYYRAVTRQIRRFNIYLEPASWISVSQVSNANTLLRERKLATWIAVSSEEMAERQY